jgi:LysR family transcriptional regulator for bpeEF and oprC
MTRSQTAPRGNLRVHMPVGFGRRVIVPALPRFIERYPDIVVDVELSDRIIDLAYEGIDVAIQIGEPSDARLIARKLCNLRFVACASPQYLLRRGVPATPDDLSRHDCLAYVLMQSGRYRDWQFVKNGKNIGKTISGRLNINNSDSLLEAAIAGLGIVMISNFIASEALRSGRLCAVLTDYVALGPPVSAIYRPSKNLSPRVRAFVDFVTEIITANPHWDDLGSTGRATPADRQGKRRAEAPRKRSP